MRMCMIVSAGNCGWQVNLYQIVVALDNSSLLCNAHTASLVRISILFTFPVSKMEALLLVLVLETEMDQAKQDRLWPGLFEAELSAEWSGVRV